MDAAADKTDDPTGKAQRAVQSVEVGGRLLLTLAANLAPMTLKDLAAQAGMPASRAHPHLVSYGRLGLVQQDGASGRYALGPAALQMGLTALHQCEPARVAAPVADALAASTGQAVALALWGNFGPTVIRMTDARQPLHVAMRAGTVMSLAGTATGRAFADVLHAERLAGALASTALGDNRPPPVPDSAALATLVASARADLASHGCTRATGRPIPGVNAFSAPVFNHAGDAVLAITLLGHQDHVSAAWSSPMAAALKQAAAAISASLGHRPG